LICEAGSEGMPSARIAQFGTNIFNSFENFGNWQLKNLYSPLYFIIIMFSQPCR
jgi:hypothetical protein